MNILAVFALLVVAALTSSAESHNAEVIEKVVSSFLIFDHAKLTTRFKRSPMHIPASLAENMFGGLFDTIFDQQNPVKDDTLNYCVMKQSEEKKLVDLEAYNISMNPTNLDTKTVDCVDKIDEMTSEVKRELRTKFRGQLSPNQIECVITKYTDADYAERLALMAVLSQYKITDEHKQEERRKFIKMMTDLTMSIGSCISSYG